MQNDRRKPNKNSTLDNSFISNLKHEWTLFWESLRNNPASFNSGEAVVSEEMAKALSKKRNKLNQELEKIKRDVDLFQNVIFNTYDFAPSASLPSGKSATLMKKREKLLRKMTDLTDRGQELNEKLTELDRMLRDLQNQEKNF